MQKIVLLISIGLIFLTSCGDINNHSKKISQKNLEIVNGEIPDASQKDAVTLSTVAITSPRHIKKGQSFCTGTIIKENVIMTAAHCINETMLDQYIITFGRTVQEAYSNQKTARIINAVVHEDFYSANAGNDIALILIEKNIPEPYMVAPIFKSEIKDSSIFKIAGFGITKYKNPSTETGTLRQATVYFDGPFNKNQIILKGKNGEDTCQGDSGGPAYIIEDGIHFVAGITSWGYGCGNKGYYTDVRLFNEWIDKTIFEDL